MTSIRTLAFLTIGAVFISAAYALVFSNDASDHSFDDDGGRSVRHTINGDSGEFVLKDEDRTIKADWRGDYSLNDLGTALSALDDEFEIEIKEDGLRERIEFERSGRDIEITYYLDGEEQPDGDEKDNAVAALFLKFLRASGLKSEERVSALIIKGGSASVLEELDALEGGHAMRQYAVALVEQADLSPAEIKLLTEKLDVIDSDHDLGRTLEAILEHETVTAETAPALIEAAKKIEGDHDLRQLVEAFAETPVGDDGLGLVLGLYERIESDHDLRVAAVALLENDAMTGAEAARILAAAGKQIESDHDLRLVLSESAVFFSSDGDLADAWMEAYGELDSSYDQRLALEEIAEAVEGDPDLKAAYRKAARRIDSDHDRERALEAIGEEMAD